MFSFLPVDMIECGQSFPHTVNLPGCERSFGGMRRDAVFWLFWGQKPIVLETFFSIPENLAK